MRKVLLIESHFLFQPLRIVRLCINEVHALSTAGYPSAQTAPAVSQQPYPGTYAIIQPSVVVVGGCPACR